MKPINRATIKALYHAGAPVRAIAYEYGMSTKAMWKLLATMRGNGGISDALRQRTIRNERFALYRRARRGVPVKALAAEAGTTHWVLRRYWLRMGWKLGPAKMQPKLRRFDHRKALRLVQAGLSRGEVAKRMGVTRQALGRAVARLTASAAQSPGEDAP